MCTTPNRLTKCSECGSRRLVINIYRGLFCPIIRRIAFCPQSSHCSISIAFFKLDFSDIVSSDGKILIQRSLLKKMLTDTRGSYARVHMCRSLCSDTLFFLVLRIFWEEQLVEQFWYFNFSLYLVVFWAEQ